ncbi:MAG: hypothetical protein ACTHMW_12295 [Actinomycetes bacterium]
MKRALIVALVAAPFLLALSYPWRDATHGVGAVLSGVGWFGFLLSILAVLVIAVAMGVRRLRLR